MINYSLIENTMNPGSREHIAKVTETTKLTLDDILDSMVEEGTGLTRPQALAYFEKLAQIIENFIQNRGSTINTPLFRLQVTISGVFRDEDDKFDPARHQINIRMTPGKRLQKLESKIKVKKTERTKIYPVPEMFFNAVDSSGNKNATPGNIASISGLRLKFDPNDPEQGVFFISQDNPKNVIRVTSYGSIKPSIIHFLIPSLQTGIYTISVKTILKNHKSIREGKLPDSITVM